MLKRFVQILAVAGIAAGLVSGPVWACDKEAKAAQTAEAKCDKPCCAKKADAAVAEKSGAKGEATAAANGGCAKAGSGCSKAAKTSLEAKKSDKTTDKAKDELAAKTDDKTAGTH